MKASHTTPSTPRSSARPSVFRRSRALRVGLIALAVVTFATAAVVCAGLWTASAGSAASLQASGALEGELFVIRPEGFLPAEIKRPAGPFFLAIHNRTGVSQASFKIESSSGSTVVDVQFPSDRLDWERIVDLPPDTYTVTETTRGWTCRLTVGG
jgi:hypothetical protein